MDDVTDDHRHFDLQIDLVYDAEAIAALTGLNSRSLAKWAAQGLPVFNIGRVHCADRRQLEKWVEAEGNKPFY